MTDSEMFAKRTGGLSLASTFLKYVGTEQEGFIVDWICQVLEKPSVVILDTDVALIVVRSATLFEEREVTVWVKKRGEPLEAIRTRWGRSPLEHVGEGREGGNVDSETPESACSSTRRTSDDKP